MRKRTSRGGHFEVHEWGSGAKSIIAWRLDSEFQVVLLEQWSDQYALILQSLEFKQGDNYDLNCRVVNL